MATTRQAIKHGWRSGLEERVAKELSESGIKYEYESMKIKYDVIETRTYTPDFILPRLYSPQWDYRRDKRQICCSRQKEALTNTETV